MRERRTEQEERTGAESGSTEKGAHSRERSQCESEQETRGSTGVRKNQEAERSPAGASRLGGLGSGVRVEGYILKMEVHWLELQC